MSLGTKTATVEHDGIEYDLYDDDGRLWSVALAGSQVDLVDVLKPTVIAKLEELMCEAQSAAFTQMVNEQLEDRAMSRAAYA